MALLYSPPNPHGHFYYEASQLAAFALYVGLLLAQGYQRGYAWRSWLPLVAAATLALVLGCQLVFLAPGDWLAWLGGDAELAQAVAGGPRSVVGGAAFSLVAVLALRRALGFRGWGVLDAFAGPLCWALAVQSVGCVLVGCCWGEPTAAGSWGLVYGPDTLAYAAQLTQGLLPAGAPHALPVVPTQLYHLLLCAGTGLALHLLRRRATGWPGGSRYLLAMGLLCLGRFGIEFWRDAASEPLWHSPLKLAGCTLPGVQWLLLFESTVLLGAWGWLVRRAELATVSTLTTPAAGAPVLVGLGLLAATARLAPSTLTLPETLVLQALLLAVLLAEAYTALLSLGRNLPRLAGLPLGILLVVALVGSTAQAPVPQRAAPPTEPIPRHKLMFSAGSLRNQYDEHQAGGCSGPASSYYHQSQTVGAEIAYQWAPDTVRHGFTTVGGGVWAGTETIGIKYPTNTNSSFVVADPDYIFTSRLYDVHLYTAGHRLSASRKRELTYRIGVHLGQLDNTQAADFNARVLPELLVAYGNRRLLFGQGDLGYGAENALGNYTARLALGSGLGQRYGSTVLLGYAESYHYPSRNMGFVSANLRIPGHSALSGLSLEPYFATDFDRHQQFSLKLHYQLGLR